ncbi:MAG: DUF4358 domain-containing protein [Clostridia bacterium]|nr:DUF4358 domain-containing protein [Clostridia bacterium]
MKIKIFAFLFAFTMLFALASCGEKKEITIDIEALAAEISEIYKDGEIELTNIGEETVDINYGIKGLYSYVHCEGSITLTSDEILVIEATDEANAEKAYEIIEEYRLERIKLYSSYAMDQVPKLEDALLERAGKYIIFVVSEDTSEAEKIWNEYKG